MMKAMIITVIYTIALVIINGCGRIDKPMSAEKNNTSKYRHCLIIGGLYSHSNVYSRLGDRIYLMFGDRFIEVIGAYAIKEK